MVAIVHGCYGGPLPLLMVLLCLLIAFTCSALLKSTSLSTDQSALLALKLQITADPYEFLSKNWSEASSVCDWIGVKCGPGYQRVAELDISSMNLTGTLPPQLGNLTFLVYLDVHNNSFHGALPEEIGNLQLLEELYLSGNHLEGVIPPEMGNLKKLRIFYLDENRITGSIPKEIGNLTRLSVLQFGENSLTGEIPKEMRNLQDLVELYLPHNSLGGSIPFGIFNLSSVREISLEYNFFTGFLPPNLGHGLPNLEKLHLNSNNVSGTIPASIANSSRLIVLSLDDNHFDGSVPNSFGDLSLLEELSLAKNNLTTQPSSSELNFVTSLANCRRLRILMIYDNPFNGVLPGSLGNFSTSLEEIYAYSCGFKGSIPSGIGNLSNIIGIKLDENQLTGVIPESVKDLQSFQFFSLGTNNLGGSLHMLCGLRSLAFLYLTQNQFSGSIPECLGNMTSLRDIFLGSNRLTSTIPKNLWNLNYLLRLELTWNYLSGTLAKEMRNLAVVISIDLSWNNISGNIPKEIGEMENLAHLNLSNNNLTGPIPESFSGLVSLESLNLSTNNLTGVIPKSLETLRSLEYFNVSFNRLRGEIPSGGPFRNFNSESFISNEHLCGEPKFHVPQCPLPPPPPPRKSRLRKLLQFLFYAVAIASVVTMVTMFLCWWFQPNYAIPSGEGWPLCSGTPRLSYYELIIRELLEATNGFDQGNLLGRGSFGSVYKATMRDGMVVAVKLFEVQCERSVTSFGAESTVLNSVRHRNLLKIISCCNHPDLKALVLEYMRNGNLEKWLYSGDHSLTILQRLNIMIDVANALRYLHHEYLSPLVHCDVKPTNILLDENMVGCLGDFGVSEFLGIDNSVAYTKTLATFGYIAPEYGSYGLVSTKCDVYSFGIILMEVFTARRPNDEIFGGKWNLKSWVAKSMPNQVIQVADAKLFNENEQQRDEKLDCLCSIMDLALSCTVESPKDRINIRDVLGALKMIKNKFVQFLVLNGVEEGICMG